MCEGITRAGNGICQMATTSESIIGKCSKLVRASQTYILKNVSIDWGVRTNLAAAYRTGSTELMSVRQAPTEIPAIYPGNRFIVSALVDDERFAPPNEVVIRAQRDGQGEFLQFSVPIQVVEFPLDHPHALLIPTLAARRAIMDLDDGSHGEASPEIKAIIVRLGTEHQLASRYTSFVGVDKRTRNEVAEPLRKSPDNVTASYTHMRFDATSVDSSSSVLAGEREQARRKTRMLRTKTLAWKTQAHARPLRFTDSRVDEGEDSEPDAAPSIGDNVLAVVRLQSYDGSFSASEQLAVLVGRQALKEYGTLGVDAKVWATVLAVAFLKRYIADQPELLDGLVEKAMDFVSRASGVAFETLLARAFVSLA